MTDREAINATFKAICALAEKLTGERLGLQMRLEDGRIVWLTSDNLEPVTWVAVENANPTGLEQRSTPKG